MISFTEPIQLKKIPIFEKGKKRIYQVTEILYLMLLAIYFAYGMLSCSMFQLGFDFYEKMNKILLIVVLVKTLFSFEQFKKHWLGIVFVYVAFASCYIHCEYDDFVFIPLFIVGAMNVPYKKILKLFFWVSFFVLLISVAGAMSGCVHNLTYDKNSQLRYSMGMCYPTDFSAMVLFSTFAFWVCYGESKEIAMVIIFAIETIVFYKLCFAWCSSMVAGLAGVLALHHYSVRKWNNGEYCRKITNILSFIKVMAFPIAATIMLSLTALYGTGNRLFVKLDLILSNRLRLGYEAFDKYGIRLFGSSFRMIGMGWADRPRAELEAIYNFVDSSYCMVLVRYGILVFLAMGCIHIMVSLRAKKNNPILLTVMALMALQCMIEHHLTELWYNPFMLLAFVTCYEKKTADNVADENVQQKRGVAAVLIGIAIIGIMFFVLNLSRIRTIVTISSLYKNENYYIFILGVLAYVFSVLLICMSVQRFIKKRNVILLAMSLMLYIVICGAGVAFSQSDYKTYKERFTQEEALVSINRMQDKYDFKLYAEDVPYYYKKWGMDISSKTLQGNALSYCDNTALITRDSSEYYKLLENGYFYCELANGRLFYTNNAETISDMSNEGYEFKNKFIKEEF